VKASIEQILFRAGVIQLSVMVSGLLLILAFGLSAEAIPLSGYRTTLTTAIALFLLVQPLLGVANLVVSIWEGWKPALLGLALLATACLSRL
jgi:hypothetical protein